MAELWWIYLIECRGGKLYTGIAKDPLKRFRRHLAGRGAAFTRINRPVALVAQRPCGSRSDALRAERALRRLDPRQKRAWAREAGSVGEPPEVSTVCPESNAAAN